MRPWTYLSPQVLEKVASLLTKSGGLLSKSKWTSCVDILRKKESPLTTEKLRVSGIVVILFVCVHMKALVHMKARVHTCVCAHMFSG